MPRTMELASEELQDIVDGVGDAGKDLIDGVEDAGDALVGEEPADTAR